MWLPARELLNLGKGKALKSTKLLKTSLEHLMEMIMKLIKPISNIWFQLCSVHNLKVFILLWLKNLSICSSFVSLCVCNSWFKKVDFAAHEIRGDDKMALII